MFDSWRENSRKFSQELRAKSGCFSGCCGFTEINSPWLPRFSHDSPMASGSNQCLWPVGWWPSMGSIPLNPMKSHEIPWNPMKSHYVNHNFVSSVMLFTGFFKDHHLPQEVIFANWPIPCCLAKQHGTVRHYCHLLPFEGNIYIYIYI